MGSNYTGHLTDFGFKHGNPLVSSCFDLLSPENKDLVVLDKDLERVLVVCVFFKQCDVTSWGTCMY